MMVKGTVTEEAGPPEAFFSAEYAETSGGIEMTEHYHNSHEIIYVVDGEAQFSINGRSYSAPAGSLVFISNLESHRIKALTPVYRRYYVLINPDWLQSAVGDPVLTSLFKHRPAHFSHVLPVPSRINSDISRFMQLMHGESATGRQYGETALKSLLNLFLIQLYRECSFMFPIVAVNSSMEILLEIQKFVDSHYLEELYLADVSKLFHLNMYYLSHLFKKVTGFPFKEYLVRLRISKAKELLQGSSSSITVVAMSSGFCNVNHFIRIFKKYEGTTPDKFRRKGRN